MYAPPAAVDSTSPILPNVPTSPMSGVTYDSTWPLQMHSATLGNGLTETRGYSPQRTWPTSLQVGSGGAVYGLTIGYAGNGNVTSANDCGGGNCVNGNWTYGYDDFNRLASATNAATNPSQVYTYAYDRFGNRWQQNYTQGQGAGWPMQLSFNASNQISTEGYRYDAAGNLQMDNANCYTYDAENRLSSVAPWTTPTSGVCGATTMSYLYDPDGRRVGKFQNLPTVAQYYDYYDAAGQMIEETDGRATRPARRGAASRVPRPGCSAS
jgi:YD repeat-containing protein